MFSKRGTLGLVCVATAMLMLDIAVVNTALPRIAHDLHSGLSGVQWVIDAYTLTLASVVLSAGSLSDRFGRRLIFAIGMGLFTIASLACALAGSMPRPGTARTRLARTGDAGRRNVPARPRAPARESDRVGQRPDPRRARGAKGVGSHVIRHRLRHAVSRNGANPGAAAASRKGAIAARPEAADRACCACSSALKP
jgi:hypothetical protein